MVLTTTQSRTALHLDFLQHLLLNKINSHSNNKTTNNNLIDSLEATRLLRDPTQDQPDLTVFQEHPPLQIDPMEQELILQERHPLLLLITVLP